MTTLYVIREQIKQYYASYSAWADRLIRGLLSLCLFLTIYVKFGYMVRIHHFWLPILLAVVCAFIPYGLVALLAAVYILLNAWAVSLEVFLVVAAVMILIFCFYFVFQPSDGFVVVLIALASALHLPVPAVIAVGFLGTAYSMIPVMFGTLIYHILDLVRTNIATLSSSGSLTMAGRYLQMITGIMANKTMWVAIVAMGLTTLCVYVIRRLSVAHSWRIAILASVILNMVILFIGVFAYDIHFSILLILLNELLAAGVGMALEFFLFHQDYSRTEYVQFEDDDYYYYVKAVPKVNITQPELTVQKINEQNKEHGEGGEALFDIRPDLGNTSEILTAGRDLEETKSVFEQAVSESIMEEAFVPDETAEDNTEESSFKKGDTEEIPPLPNHGE